MTTADGMVTLSSEYWTHHSLRSALFKVKRAMARSRGMASPFVIASTNERTNELNK